MLQVPDKATGIKTQQPRHRRRRRNSYRFSIERRAAAAAAMVGDGCPLKQAAGMLCVNPAYVGLASHLSADDQDRLARGELKLSALYQDYRQRLAERRSQRLAAEREAQAQAWREAQTRAIDGVLASAGLGRVVDRLVSHFGPGGLMAVLDAATRPQRVAAE